MAAFFDGRVIGALAESLRLGWGGNPQVLHDAVLGARHMAIHRDVLRFVGWILKTRVHFLGADVAGWIHLRVDRLSDVWLIFISEAEC